MKLFKAFIICSIIAVASLVSQEVKAQNQDFPGWTYRGAATLTTSLPGITLKIHVYEEPSTSQLGWNAGIEGGMSTAFMHDGLFIVSGGSVLASGLILYIPSPSGMITVTVPDGSYTVKR